MSSSKCRTPVLLPPHLSMAEAVVVQDPLAHYVSPLTHDKPGKADDILLKLDSS